MPDRSDAIRYARAGYAIIPVHTVNPDGSCSCGDPHVKSQSSIGKHPLTIHGVSNATRRGSTITEWFIEPHNIGIACGPISNGLCIADIDDTALATTILRYFTDNSDILRPPVSLTTRGIHLWFICPNEPNSKLTRIDGVHLGEIRAHDQYAIGPPSCTVANGEPRRWWGQDGDAIPEAVSVDSIRDYIETTCRIVGTELAPERGPVDIGDRPETIEAIALPFKARKTVLKNILAGKYPTDDRSGVLFRLVREVQEQAERDGYAVSIAELAGIAKAVDRAHYHKYDGASDGRTDGDQRYWEVASRGGVEGPSGAAQSATGASGAGDAGQGQHYRWTDADGGQLWHIDGKRERLVANCRPEIVREIRILSADVQPTGSHILRITLADGTAIEVELNEVDLRSSLAIRKALRPRLPYRYIIEPEGWDRLWNAASEFAGRSGTEVQQVEAYGDTGWHGDVTTNAYTLPTIVGSITENGVNVERTFHGWGADAPDRWNLYGVGVRPAETPSDYATASSALSDLLDLLPAEIGVPLLAQTLGGVLCSLGLFDSPPLLHLEGNTGQFKTSTALVFLSLLGRFSTRSGTSASAVPLSWASTNARILAALYYLRDLPVLIDDYKTIHKAPVEAAKVVQLYADRTTRDRMGSGQELLQSYIPRGLIISTGQTNWETETSVAARTLILPWTTGVVTSDRLSLCQEQAAAGNLAIVGGTFIRYVARHMVEVRQHLIDYRMSERSMLAGAIPDLHPRAASTVGSLRAAEQIIVGFMREEFPLLADRFTTLREEHSKALLIRLGDDAKGAKNLAALQVLLAAIREMSTTREVTIAPRSHEPRISLIGARTVVGHYDEEFVYLTKSATYGWYREWAARQREPVHFTWSEVLRDARETLGGWQTAVRIQGKIVWALVLSRDAAQIVREEIEDERIE